MRHRKYSIRFGRQRSHYKATLRHLVSGLIINKTIRTTKVKAKESSRLADKLVTLGKRNTVASRRAAYAILRDRNLVSILFNEIAPLFNNRNGGYTRVFLTGRRHGDNAQMAILEFVEKPVARVETKPEKRKEPEVKPLPSAPEKAKQPPKEPEKPKEAEEKKPKFFKRIFRRRGV